MNRILYLIFICFLFAFLGCGKKISHTQSNQKPVRIKDPVLAEEEIYLKSQQVLCESKSFCPESVAKIVVFENRTPRICTGFLVSEDVVATASTCLPKVLRLKNQACTGDVTFLFPETRLSPALRVGCEKVLLSSDPQGNDPVLWRENLSFLKLAGKVSGRKPFILDRAGMPDNNQISFWFVDQVDKEVGFLRKKTCTTVFNSYVNPLATNQSSPNQLLGNCAALDSSLGAPLVNESGRVSAVVSYDLPKEIRRYLESTGLLTRPLKPMLLATNIACAATIFDYRVLDQKECFKSMTQEDLNTKRDILISNESFFEKEKKILEEKLDQSNIFIKFKVSVELTGDVRSFKIEPWCFKNVNSWLWRINPSRGNYGFGMELPQIKMKRNMDHFGHIGSEFVMDLSQEIYVEFSVKQLKKSKSSDVVLWNEVLSDRFLTVNSKCQ